MLKTNKYDTKTLKCKNNYYTKLLSKEYAMNLLFAKRFERNLFAIKAMSGLLYTIGAYGEQFYYKDHKNTIEDLKLLYGKKAIDCINSPALMSAVNIAQSVEIKDNGKIKLTQHFPVSERNILELNNSKDENFKLLAFPLSVGGYCGWDKRKLISIVPTKYKKGFNFSGFLYEVMSLDINSENFLDDLQKMSDDYCCGYEMIVVDRVKNKISLIHYKKMKGKYIVIRLDNLDDKCMCIGSDKAIKDQKDEEFVIEI